VFTIIIITNLVCNNSTTPGCPNRSARYVCAPLEENGREAEKGKSPQEHTQVKLIKLGHVISMIPKSEEEPRRRKSEELTGPLPAWRSVPHSGRYVTALAQRRCAETCAEAEGRPLYLLCSTLSSNFDQDAFLS